MWLRGLNVVIDFVECIFLSTTSKFHFILCGILKAGHAEVESRRVVREAGSVGGGLGKFDGQATSQAIFYV